MLKSKTIKIALITLILSALMLTSAALVPAATRHALAVTSTCQTVDKSLCTDNQSDPANANPKATCSKDNCPLFTKYLNPFIAFLSAIVGVVVVGAIIFGGIEISSSAGDPQKAASGKKHIQNAIIALVAFVLLYAFLEWLVPGGII